MERDKRQEPRRERKIAIRVTKNKKNPSRLLTRSQPVLIPFVPNPEPTSLPGLRLPLGGARAAAAAPSRLHRPPIIEHLVHPVRAPAAGPALLALVDGLADVAIHRRGAEGVFGLVDDVPVGLYQPGGVLSL